MGLCGVVFANFAGFSNPLFGIVVFFVGCIVPVAVVVATRKFLTRINPLPLCRNKRCGSRKYEVEKHLEEGTYYRCRCGDLYLLTPDDKFLSVSSDGSVQPYMQRFDSTGYWWPAPEVFEKYRSAKNE